MVVSAYIDVLADGDVNIVGKGYPFAVASGFAAYNPEKDGDTPDVNVITERSDKEMYANKQEIKAKNTEYSRK